MTTLPNDCTLWCSSNCSQPNHPCSNLVSRNAITSATFVYPFLFIFSTYPCIWINCIRHISFVSSGECLNQALPLLPFPGGRDTSPDTARCSRFTVFIEELHLESFRKLHKRIFKQQFVGSKSFHGQGAIVVTGHYLRFEFSLKSWIDDFTISKRGHS